MRRVGAAGHCWSDTLRYSVPFLLGELLLLSQCWEKQTPWSLHRGQLRIGWGTRRSAIVRYMHILYYYKKGVSTSANRYFLPNYHNKHNTPGPFYVGPTLVREPSDTDSQRAALIYFLAIIDWVLIQVLTDISCRSISNNTATWVHSTLDQLSFWETDSQRAALTTLSGNRLKSWENL